MPKIRCTGCETVLNAPEAARGKTIACPKCKAKFKVPAGEAKAKAAKKVKHAADDEDSGIEGLDLDHLQSDDAGGICPYCAAEMQEDDPVCRNCGMNVETGQMDAREAKRRAIKGIDPALFYSHVWKDSWAFLMENKGLALRTGVYWSLFSVMNATCAYLAFSFCKNAPTKIFWGGLTLISGLGIPGWFLYLGLKVIFSTMTREAVRADRIYFDFFQCVAAGGRMLFWPLIVIGPFLPLAILLFAGLEMAGMDISGNALLLGGILGGLALLPALVLPLALIHMTSRHPYKAWILWDLLMVLGKNFAPTIVLHLLNFAVFLPVLLVAGGIGFFLQAGNPFLSEPLTNVTGKVTEWLMSVVGISGGPESVMYAIIKGPLNIVGAAIVLTPIALLAGFPAVFLMRATGLLGYYFNKSLDLVQQIYPGTPAPFWVRYLAHTVDLFFIPLSCFLVTSHKQAMMVSWAMNGFLLLVYLFSKPLLPVFILLWVLYTSWMYWSVQEASELNATLGKDSFGLLVLTEDDRQVPLKTASLKWLLRTLWYFSAGIPFIWAAFHPEKRSLHDLVTRTKVVFKGDK